MYVCMYQDESIDPAKFDSSQLTVAAKQLYVSLPEFFLRQMMAERDPHGNVQVLIFICMYVTWLLIILTYLLSFYLSLWNMIGRCD